MTENGSTLLKNNAFSRKKYILIYTGLFAVLAFCVYFHFFKNGVSFVRQLDAYAQHYTALEYYGKWLRQIIKTLIFEHRLDIPMWDFSIGLGSDVITTFNYYVLGDPLTLLSAIVPSAYTIYLYVFLGFLRFYLSGLAFSLYCFERKHNNYFGILLAAFTYVFCHYALYAGTKHPYFINPMIYLPLIFIAVEKILKNKSPIYLAIFVCIAEVSNFYFFYVLVFATVLYVLMRLLEIYKLNIKAMLKPFIEIAVFAVIGVLLGAVIFLPTVMRLLSDNRFEVSYEYSFLYSLKYYLKLPAAFLSYTIVPPWTVLGYTAVSLFAIVALFLRKKKKLFMKGGFIVAFLGFLLPVFGVVANGLSYPANRWIFVFSFFVSYIISFNWNMLFSKNKKRTLIIALLPLAYVIMALLIPADNSRAIFSFIAVFIIAALLILYSYKHMFLSRYKKAFECAVAVICLIVTVINSYNCFKDYALHYMPYKAVTEFKVDETAAVKKQASLDGETGFYRYTSDKLAYNATVRTGLSSTQYYWSLSDGGISEFQNSINLNESYFQVYNGFDDIAAFNTLSSVKYYYDYADNDINAVPYGFEETETKGVYRNTNYLPLGYTYDSYILKEDYDKLETSVAKQQAMLQGAVVEEKPFSCSEADLKKDVQTKEYDISHSEDITYKDGVYTVTKNNSKLYIKVEATESSETYISVKDIYFEGTSVDELYSYNEKVDPNNLYSPQDFEALDEEKKAKFNKTGDSYKTLERVPLKIYAVNSAGESASTKTINYFTPIYSCYCGKHNFDVNLGYSEEGYSVIVINFPYIGQYSISDISVYTQKTDIYTSSVEKLSKEVMEDIVINGDNVSGKITVTGNKLLCLSIPYSKGWTAYVDGKETELLKANVMYMALELSEGEHEIELKYTTPNLKTGLIISVFGFVLLSGSVLCYNYQKKRLKAKGKEPSGDERN